MYRKILMPTDGSASSDLATKQGLELAKRLGAEVTFLHVLENPLTAGYATPETLPYSAQLYQDLRAAAVDLLAAAQTSAESMGVAASTRLVENHDPVQAIHEAEADHDLVVMGTHGRRGFNRWMFGSVAEGALRRSTKPFLLVRAPDGGED
ncbi:MAG: universal stress protein [Trueperaceae bacterium]|nr:universal stress protein [Trueperaceae bacterium]